MKAIPLLIALAKLSLATVAAPSITEPPPDAMRIFARHLESIGGRAAAEAETCVTISGTVTASQSNSDFTRQLPSHDPASAANWQVDVRGADLTRLDLGSRLSDLANADFDSNTRWPATLPFNPNLVLRLGQDPGLGVRALHARGITGKGVGIGIIDQPLLVNHAEYATQLRLYEEIHSPVNAPAEMHGPAVASIAVGRTCGVAPDADLYYISELQGDWGPDREFEWDFAPLAQSINRLLDVNRTLPADRKTRVISISVGWTKDQKGYTEAMAAVERASADRVFVISTSLRHTHSIMFDGLGRDALADPNVPSSYRPGAWWAAQFWSGQMRFKPGLRLCVPMDTRSTASPTGPHDYVHYAGGGWSWCVPWIAGLYALACQADPAITLTDSGPKLSRPGRPLRSLTTVSRPNSVPSPIRLRCSNDLPLEKI